MPLDRSKWGFTEAQHTAFDRIQTNSQFTDEIMEGMASVFFKLGSVAKELFLSQLDCVYFISEHVWIYDKRVEGWAKFVLWDAQIPVVYTILREKFIIILKARQLGITWLLLAILLWLILFRQGVRGLVFSKLEDDAKVLVSKERLRGMYDRLPEPFKLLAPLDEKTSKTDFLDFQNPADVDKASNVYAFTTTRGDSRVGTYVMIDEADLIPNLRDLLAAAKPTVEGAAFGKFILLSKSYKKFPNSIYKRMYRNAKARVNEFVSVFLPWYSHPFRDEAWYEKEKAAALLDGSLDSLYENYPATDEEALAANELNKRIPAANLSKCLEECELITSGLPKEIAKINGLEVYAKREEDVRYFIGIDAAEGLPTGANSAIYVVDQHGREVAHLVGKIPTDVTAMRAKALSDYYNKAKLLPENNGINLAVMNDLQRMGVESRIVRGNGRKLGWTPSRTSKILLYDNIAEAAFNGDMTLHHYPCYVELQSIESDTLNAPIGDMDDMADAFAMALMCRYLGLKRRATKVHTLDWGGKKEAFKPKNRNLMSMLLGDN